MNPKQLDITDLLAAMGFGSLERPSQSSIARLARVPLLFGDIKAKRATSGQIAYDSWAGAPANLRAATDGHIRNVILEAGVVQLDLVGEFRASRWDFVARVYRGGDVSHDFALQAGRKKLLPDSCGFFNWTSSSVVRRLKLLSLTEALTFELAKW
ncbi:MAG TPA: hypothetical protein VLB27_08310 [candidate division Zixibacteria bacterium]|nr:hypothetical protein [candidate division Zixibacteria bacterium]